MERQIAAIVKVQNGSKAMNTLLPAKIQILCTNGLKSVFLAAGDQLTRDTGIAFTADYGSTKKFTDRIAAGETPDVVILTGGAINALIAQGKLASGRTDVAKSFVGVAVRKGASPPDISTVAAFIATLRAARSISRSRIGASGLHLESLITRLGLAAELTPKIKVYDGYAAQACAEGEVEIAIQQLSELMPVVGLDIVGPLPKELQKVTMFSAGIGAATTQRAAAEKFIAYIKHRDRAAVLRANGLEPA
jgi:molybdate transport system substrate-binding protein